MREALLSFSKIFIFLLLVAFAVLLSDWLRMRVYLERYLEEREDWKKLALVATQTIENHSKISDRCLDTMQRYKIALGVIDLNNSPDPEINRATYFGRINASTVQGRKRVGISRREPETQWSDN